MNKTKAFSLIEVVIFIGILAMFFVTGMAVVVYSLQTMKVNQHKIVASQYAEQLSTWLRTQKEIDWNDFVSRYTMVYPVESTFCFNTTLAQPSLPPPGSGCAMSDYGLGTPAIFKRWVIITRRDATPSQIELDVTVEWKEGGNTYSIPFNTVVSRFE